MRPRRCLATLVALTILLVVPSSRVVCQRFKLGNYVATSPQGEVTITFADSSMMTVFFAGAVAVEGRFTVVGDSIVIVNYGGPGACPSGEVGRYQWTLWADTLELLPISDPCSARVAGLTFNRWIAKRP